MNHIAVMTSPSARVALACACLAAVPPAAASAQTHDVPLSPEAWVATDSVLDTTLLGRDCLYINRGVALARGAAMENGTLELDVAASDRTTFLGISFRAASPTFSNVIYLRPVLVDLTDDIQYGPAFNSVGVAWQVFHGPGANGEAEIPRNRWIHLRLELDGPVARFFVDTATTPNLVVPRVVASGGTGLGVWAGAFGRGAYFSNIRFTPRPATTASVPPPAPPSGALLHWELSNTIEVADFTPDALPDLARLTWQSVAPEPDGLVLINRYRAMPAGGTPRDSTGAVLTDSVMTGRMAGARVVYARTTITATRDEVRKLEYAYSNGVVIYLNGRPLVMAMNPSGMRAALASMARAGDAVYLPLRRGRNELVFAVVELTGGWAYSARLH